VNRLLQSDPAQRLGNMAAGADAVRSHAYFASTNWSALLSKQTPPPWTPARAVGKLSEDEGSHKKVAAYSGKQDVFAEWN
jgi:hypothetical protein